MRYVDTEKEGKECRFCGRPFSTSNLMNLHLGEEHREELTDDELEAYRECRELESERLSKFKIKALGGLVVVYFLLLFVFILFG